MTSAPTVRKYADQVTDWLVELGYTHCFFVAGGNIMHLLDGARTRFTCIPVVHEVAAGIAAEYFNESNGNGKAFALVTAGPGVSNIVTAMAGAWLESRELLVLAGQVKSTDLASGGIRQRGIQEVDGVGLTKSVSKHSIQLTKPISKREFAEYVNSSYSGRPGPVFLEFCLDVQGMAPVNLDVDYVSELENNVIDNSDLSQVVARLKSSSRPLLMIGGGVSRTTAVDLFDKLNEAGIPIVTTWNGADRIDSCSPFYFGRPNTWGQRAPNLIVAQADFILAVGTRLGMQQTGFNWQEFGRNAYIVHVDIDPSELHKGHPRTDMKLAVDANNFLQRLLDESYPNWYEWVSYCEEITGLVPTIDPANETREGFVSPYDFYQDLSELATTDDIIIPCSSGGANSTSMQTLQQKFGQIIITDKGLASMGYGLSGAIGAALAHPGRRTFLIEGDGGFAQNLQELATVAVNQLPIKIFIFANNGYGSIRMTQKNYFDGAYLGCDIETGLGFPDWEKLFQSFAIPCSTIDGDWLNNRELNNLLTSSGPCGIIVPIDPLQTYWPKISSRIVEGGGMESNPLHQMSPDLPRELEEKVTRYL